MTRFDAMRLLKHGTPVTIRRTSGAEQAAEVYGLVWDPFKAPEQVTFTVIWRENGRGKIRGCAALDLLAVDGVRVDGPALAY